MRLTLESVRFHIVCMSAIPTQQLLYTKIVTCLNPFCVHSSLFVRSHLVSERRMLVELGRMSKAEREENTWVGLYLWEKERS